MDTNNLAEIFVILRKVIRLHHIFSLCFLTKIDINVPNVSTQNTYSDCIKVSTKISRVIQVHRKHGFSSHSINFNNQRVYRLSATNLTRNDIYLFPGYENNNKCIVLQLLFRQAQPRDVSALPRNNKPITSVLLVKSFLIIRK